MKLTAVEWRVMALMMAEGPISAWQIAKSLRLKYAHAKRAARELARCGMVVRSEDGLRFHPHPEDWKRTQVPVAPSYAPPMPSKNDGGNSTGEEREVVFHG